MGAGDDDVVRQVDFLEDYEQGTQAAPAAPTTQVRDGARKRGPRRAGARGAGLHWVLAQSCLAVAEHALRAVDALRDEEWKPPHWLCPAVASQTTTLMLLMTRLNGKAHMWLRESGHAQD